MKKTLSIILAIIMVLLAMPLSAFAANSSGYCGNNVKWSFNSSIGKLTISGSGKMYDYNYNAPWNSIKSSIKTVWIGDGVTSIGNTAFANCLKLKSILLSPTVKSIGNYSFYDSYLASIILPDGLEYIGEYAFYNTQISQMYIPSSVATIGKEAFFVGGSGHVCDPNGKIYGYAGTTA